MMKSIALKNKNITYELVLYLGIILLAALLRFPQLGNIPLNDVEAKLALSSLEIQKGAAVTQSDQPLYVCLTSILFMLASNNFTARIVSALAGCLFAITPFFFRKWIGRSEALLIGLFFAFDPALISISRQADSRMMSLFFIVIFIASLLISKKLFAGIIGGLLILCGVPFWQLSIMLLISFFLYFQLSKDKKKLCKSSKHLSQMLRMNPIIFFLDLR